MAANIFVYALIGIVALAGLVALIKGRKKKWYIVYLANNDVQLLYRTASLWWFSDSRDRIVFRNPDGTAKVFISKWILFYEQVMDYEAAREYVLELRKKQVEAES